MKKRFSFIIFILVNVLLLNEVIAQPIERVTYNHNNIEGFVYFEGFDFNNYNHLTYPSLQEMLDITYNELVAHYKSQNKPFVFVGHSQGGLRAIAMTTYLKQRDPELYRNLRGVITVSGIDNGLKLLENRGENTRNKLKEDCDILSSGLYAVYSAAGLTIPGIPLLSISPDILGNTIFGLFINDVLGEGAYSLGTYIFTDYYQLSKEFMYPILKNEDWDNYTQVRDMCPDSDFIKKYALDVTDIQNNGGPNFEFRVGLLSDATAMIPDPAMAQSLNDYMNGGSVMCRTAQVIHITAIACGIGLFTNSIMHSINADRAASWCENYKGEINDILSGSEPNDGLVAKSSQFIPGLGKIIEYPEKNHFTIGNSETSGIWNENTDLNEELNCNHGNWSITRTVKQWLGQN